MEITGQNQSSHSTPTPWVPLRTVVTPVLKKNIEYLSIFDPTLCKQIKANAGNEELLAQEAQGLIRYRTLDEPARWIFGETSPRSELAALGDKLRRVPREAPLMVLLGTAAGYAIRLFAEPFLKNPESVLLAIDTSAARMRCGLIHTDIRPVLRSGRFHWRIGGTGLDDIFAAIDDLNLWRRNPVFLLDPMDGNWVETLRRFQLEYAERSSIYERRRTQTIERIRSRRDQPENKEIHRVLLLDCWKHFPQGLHIQSIRNAFQRRGMKTQMLELDGVRIDLFEAPYRRLQERSLLDTLDAFQPDLIVSYAYHAPHILGRELFEAVGRPWLQIVSNFAFYDRTYYENEYSAIAECRLIPDYQKRGAAHPFFVPLMANYTAEQPAPTSRRYPVVFVGNPFSTPPEEAEQFRQRFEGRPALWEAVHSAIAEVGDFDRGYNLFDYLEANPLPQVRDDREYYDLFRHVLCATAEKRRRTLLEQIAGKGLALFGNWEAAVKDSPLQPCFQRYLPIQEEPALFSEGHIFVNIHTAANLSSPNMRFFNVAGMGGFLLSDGNFSDFLEPGKEMACFDSVADFVEKVRYYIAHPDETDAIRERGLARIRRDWTYDQWIDWVFKEIGIHCP